MQQYSTRQIGQSDFIQVCSCEINKDHLKLINNQNEMRTRTIKTFHTQILFIYYPLRYESRRIVSFVLTA